MRQPHARRFPRFGFLLTAALLLGACSSGDDADADVDMTDGTADASSDASSGAAWLDDLAVRYQAHYNAGHADSIAAMYAEDAVVLGADGTVASGREAIRTWNAGQMEQGSPQLEVEILDRRVFGDTALAVGSYTVTMTPAEGEAVEMAGHWMAAYGASPTGWKTLGLITNHDRQMSAEYLQGTASDGPPPSYETSMEPLLDAYEAAWNAGDADGVANLYAEDAWAAFVDLPAIEGRAAIASALGQRIPGSQIALTDIRTVDLGDGWMVDGGRFALTREDGDDAEGHYWVLTHAGEDGEPRIQWALSNGRPTSVIPAAGGM